MKNAGGASKPKHYQRFGEGQLLTIANYPFSILHEVSKTALIQLSNFLSNTS
jgi:hypothetical protein